MIIKKFKYNLWFLVNFLTLLSVNGCNSFYNNEYIYLPPENIDARECILTCRHERESCNSAANKAYQECLREAERSSMLNYTIDLNNQQTSVTTKDMNTLEQCRTYSKACDRGYNECYVNCGGKVEVNDYSTVR